MHVLIILQYVVHEAAKAAGIWISVSLLDEIPPDNEEILRCGIAIIVIWCH